MAFVRVKAGANGKFYATLEERYRENGKVKSRIIASLGPIGGSGKAGGPVSGGNTGSGGAGGAATPEQMRSAARILYNDALAQNQYAFGRSRPGERYVREAEARAAFHRYLDSEKAGKPTLPETNQEQAERLMSSLGGGRTVGLDARGAAARSEAKAQDRYMQVKAEVQAEDRQIDKDEMNAQHAQWSANQAAQRDEDMEAYYDATGSQPAGEDSRDAPEPDAPADGT